MLKINNVSNSYLLNNKIFSSPPNRAKVQRFVSLELRPIRDVFCRAINNVVMKKDDNYCHYSFYDNGRKIGYAIFDKSDIEKTCKGLVPEDWFVEGAEPIEGQLYPLKPHIYINELVMYDRVGLEGEYSQRLTGKKYGTMCLQKILEWSERYGFGSRISLTPGKTHSDIEPNKFYAKVGFEMSPTDIKNVEKLEARYSSEPSLYNRSKYEKINGRWVAKAQVLFLTHPEVLREYHLK